MSLFLAEISPARAAYLVLGALLLSLNGCSKTDDQAQTPPAQSPAPQTVAPAPPIDPCTLLTSEEVAAVQGEAIVDTKPSQNFGKGIAMYDCFVTLPTFTNSISLSVTQSGPGPDAVDAGKMWRETFDKAKTQASEKEPPPKAIEGIGDEAYWTGNERMGALYVLKGTRYLRISVGGPGDQAAKIEKSRALAEAALKRL